MHLFDALETVRRLLREEQHSEHFLSPGQMSLAQREQRRQRISTLLNQIPQQIQQDITQLRQEFLALPHLPSSQEIAWARSVLALPNLAFLELDTTRLTAGASLLRVTLIDGHGTVVEDLILHPQEPVSQVALDLAGLTRSQVEQAPPIHDVWDRIQEGMTGRYLLSFALDLFRDRLREQAATAQRVPLTFLGESLRPHMGAYFGEIGYHYERLCASLGTPLPDHPKRTSLHRAQRNRMVLHVMAQGQQHMHDVNQMRPQARKEGDADV